MAENSSILPVSVPRKGASLLTDEFADRTALPPAWMLKAVQVLNDGRAAPSEQAR